MEEKIKALEDDIKKLESKKNETTNLFNNIIDNSKRTELIRIYKEIDRQIKFNKSKLYNELLNYRKISLSDGVIDLINVNESSYNIYLSGEDECIGFIDYRPANFDNTGNIGYKIKEEYRGNNYAFRALNLVATKLLKEGIEEIVITANETNIPSIKIIEKFGGILIGKEQNILIYKCNLKNKNKNEKVEYEKKFN